MNCSDRTVSAWQHGRVFLSTCQQNSPSDHDAGVCASTEDNILFFFSATLFPLAFIPLGILTCLFPSEFHTPSSPLLYLIWLHRPSSNACLGYPLGRFNYLTSFLALHVCSCSLLHFFFLPHSLHVFPITCLRSFWFVVLHADRISLVELLT